MDRGEEVVVVSPRASAAHLHAPLGGLGAARSLWRLRRSTGSDALVMCVEPGMPLTDGAVGLRRSLESRILRAVLRVFSRVTLLAGAEPDVIAAELQALGRASGEIVVGSSRERQVAAAILGTSRVRVVVENVECRGSGELNDGDVTRLGPPETELQGVAGRLAARAERAAYLAEHAAAKAAHVVLGDNAHKLGGPLRRLVEPVRARLIRKARGNAARP